MRFKLAAPLCGKPETAQVGLGLGLFLKAALNFLTREQENVKRLHLVVLLAAILLLGQTNTLIASWLNNQASLVLIREYHQPSTFLRCIPQIEHSMAVPLLEKALSFSSSNQRIWLNLGRTAWLEGKCQQAVDFWQHALELSSKDVIALWQAANTLYAIGETEKALEFYRSAQAERFFYNLAYRAQQENDLTRALENYKIGTIIAPDPERSDYWWAVGQIGEINQEWQTALWAYEQAIPLEKNYYRLYEIYMHAGTVAQQQKDYLMAAKYFEHAIETHPQSVWGYLSRGNLERMQGQYSQAIEWYQRAERVDSKSEWPLYYQGVLLWEMGQKEQAQIMFIDAEKRNPQNPSVQFYLGLDAYERNELNTAINHLHQAIELYPNKPPKYWLELLGDWQLQAKYCIQSIATYQRLLEEYPDDSNIQQRLKKAHEACR